MIQPEEFREQIAARLLADVQRASHLRAFVGLDGFVDQIIHVVDKRDDATNFSRLPTIGRLADRLAAAAGRSTNVELVVDRTKLGGNGPIMANALARMGIKVTYLGAVGYPSLHPVFKEFAQRADVYSITDPGQTDALEFEDGKVMLTKTTCLNEVTWANIQRRYGRDRFIEQFSTSDLVAFVNWTMIPYMSDLWDALLQEFCPARPEVRRRIFFDLADPEKRTTEDIARALQLIGRFQKFFDVILGLNEKEAFEIARVLGLETANKTRDGLADLTLKMRRQTGVTTLVVHPVTFALAATGDAVALVDGPFIPKPMITTGAGDHFNSGFCLGNLLGFDTAGCLLTGVSTSGYYVRTGQSPDLGNLAELLRDWPE
jgi:sugar/nucleoside kinase (ribokinase family)